MSMVETLSDVKNTFLSRREITCNFKGLAGKLKKPEAIEMITKEFKLNGKVVIPIKLRNHTGIPTVTGTFHVYDDEKQAKKYVNPVIWKRLGKAKEPKEKPAEEKKESKPAEEKKESKPAEEKKESKPAEEKK